MKKRYILFSVAAIVAVAMVIFVFVRSDEDKGVVTEVTDCADVVTVEDTTVKILADNTLFIGDSRSVGLCKYADMGDADFFAIVGMTVFRIREAVTEVEGMGEVTLDMVLSSKQYSRIYVMLGVNEAGYALNNIVNEYSSLLAEIAAKQPEAKIVIQANLKVTDEFSQKSESIKNEAIDRINQSLATFADGRKIFFIDANPVFADDNGCLDPMHSSDGIHLYADSYAAWGEWIKEQIV